MPPGTTPCEISLYRSDFDGSPFEELAVAAAKPRAAGFVERKLARGQQAHITHRI